MNSRKTWWLLLVVLGWRGGLLAQEPRSIVEEAQKRSYSMSQRYEGTLRVISEKSKIAEKRWTYDRIGSHGDSKSVLRFTAPAEVKGVALLVIARSRRAVPGAAALGAASVALLIPILVAVINMPG